MDTKKIFGIILTSLGIIGILYGAYIIIQAGTFANIDWTVPGVVFIVSFIFFIAGISLIKNVDNSERHEHHEHYDRNR